MLKADQFKIRASACGLIMTNPRKKTEVLSETCKTYLKEWTISELFGKSKMVTSKYMSKGIVMEDEAIDMVAEKLGISMLLKNEAYASSEFIQGTPDIITTDTVIDVKCSWDAFTFPLFETDIPNKQYYYQLQCYGGLVGADNLILAYCLVDTPLHLIESEVSRQAYQLGNSPDLYDKVKANLTYENIPISQRVKLFKFETSKDEIKRIEERVIDCRKYINDILLPSL